MMLSVAAFRATSVTGSCCQGHLAAELDGEVSDDDDDEEEEEEEEDDGNDYDDNHGLPAMLLLSGTSCC